MNVSGVAQEQMVSSFIMKKLNPLYLFFFQGLSGIAQGHMVQSWKKGCSTAAMLPEGNRQDHFWQKDFGQLFNICHIFD